MVDVLAAPQQAKADSSRRTLAAISTAHWVSHFHIFVLPMLFPFLKNELGVGYIELGFALTIFAVVSGVTQAPIGYLADHIGARKILLMGLTLGGFALIMLGLHLSYPWLIVSAALLGPPTASIIRPIMRSSPPIWMNRGWAAPFRSTPLPASSAARSRRPPWRRWLQPSAAMAH
jgi:MFS family permease